MPTITFTCETITPMFLSGADGSTPELRPPSIKGALRFWWRAMNGHLANTANGGIPNLLQEDERLFGGVNEGRKSSVLVRTAIIQEKSFFGKNIDATKEGLAYLLYILVHQQKEREGYNASNIDKDKTKLKVTLSSQSTDDLKKGVASFWLFTFLGGIGTRARRGAGAIAVNEIEDKDNILDDFILFKPQNGVTMDDFIKNTLTKIKEQFPNTKKSQVNNEYSTIASNHIYVSKKDNSDTWEEALNDIGDVMFKLRKGKTSWDKNKRTFTMDTLDQKASFGIPVAVMVKDNSVSLLNNERRSSPIWISIIRNSEGKFQWTVTHLKGKFLENGDKITFTTKNPKVRKKEYSWDKENPSLLTKFINQIKEQATQINY